MELCLISHSKRKQKKAKESKRAIARKHKERERDTRHILTGRQLQFLKNSFFLSNRETNLIKEVERAFFRGEGRIMCEKSPAWERVHTHTQTHKSNVLIFQMHFFLMLLCSLASSTLLCLCLCPRLPFPISRSSYLSVYLSISLFHCWWRPAGKVVTRISNQSFTLGEEEFGN